MMKLTKVFVEFLGGLWRREPTHIITQILFLKSPKKNVCVCVCVSLSLSLSKPFGEGAIINK
jgi:hypothetical protein